MKKLLVLALVLGVASMASATLLTVIADDAEILLGDTTTVNIVAAVDYGMFDGEDWVIGVSAEGALSDITVADVAGAVLVSNGDAAMFGVPGGFWGVTMAPAVGIITEGTVLFSLTLTGMELGIAQINMIDLTAGGVPGASTSVLVTPEPMTMALLGLGGLFLRRRK